MSRSNKSGASIALALMFLALISAAQTSSWPRKVIPSEPLLAPKIRYRLIEKFGPVKYCDSDCLGPCNLTGEKKNAEDVFPLIRKDTETFSSITEHLGLAGTSQFTMEQKLSVYREYKKLVQGLKLDADGKNLRFKMPEANGFQVEGVVSPEGEITVEKKEPGRIFCPL